MRLNEKKQQFAHAGEILERNFITFNNLSQNQVSKRIGVAQSRISELVTGTKRFNPDLDLRLCRFFGLPDGSFLDTQTKFDLKKKFAEIEDTLNMIVPLRKFKK